MKSSAARTADARRSRYLEIALGLFIEHGYPGVSMDQIVAAAGGSKATLYRYFSSKEQLFSAIVDELQTVVGAAPPTQDVIDLDLADGLRVLARATADGALSDRAIVLMRLAVGEHSRFPELGRLLFELAPERSYVRLKDFLRAKREHGEVEFDDAQIAAEQFLAGLVGHQQLRMLLGVSRPSDAEVEQRIEAAVRTFVRTYATEPDAAARSTDH